MKPTSQHMADHALRLFNKRGFANVRLQHIADAAFVSVGHLAYYFKNKEALVHALFEQHRLENEALLQAYRIMPLFSDIDRMFCAVYLLQEKFSFLYTDVLELLRAYPDLASRYAAHTQLQKVQLTMMIDFQLSRGALQLPHGHITAEMIATLLQQYLQNWRYTQASEAKLVYAFEQFSNDAWKMLLPFCGQLGLQELQLEINHFKAENNLPAKEKGAP